MTKYLCVYCGASERCDEVYKEAAKNLGNMIGAHDYGLVYGGGRSGIMGIVADATLSSNGRAVGFIPEHLDEREGAHFGLTELHIVDSMHTRKQRMSERADMFVILPGGFGTLDEMFEILTWKQLNIHQKPIVLLNINGYWDPLESLINKVIDERFAYEEHRSFVQIVHTPAEVIEIAKKIF